MIITPRLRGEAIGPEHPAEMEELLCDPRVSATLARVSMSSRARIT